MRHEHVHAGSASAQATSSGRTASPPRTHPTAQPSNGPMIAVHPPLYFIRVNSSNSSLLSGLLTVEPLEEIEIFT